MTTFEQQINKLKNMFQEGMRELDKLAETERRGATIEEFDRRVQSLQLQHKDAYTLNEVSERTGIPKKTLYRHVKSKKLRAREGDGINKIVLREDLLDFLTQLPEAH